MVNKSQESSKNNNATKLTQSAANLCAYFVENTVRRCWFLCLQKDGSLNGTVEVSLKWAYSYLPPKSATRTPAQEQVGLDDTITVKSLI